MASSSSSSSSSECNDVSRWRPYLAAGTASSCKLHTPPLQRTKTIRDSAAVMERRMQLGRRAINQHIDQ